MTHRWQVEPISIYLEWKTIDQINSLWEQRGFTVERVRHDRTRTISHPSRHALTLLALRDPEFLEYYIVEEL